MKGIIITTIMSVTGWFGWWLGSHIGLITALILSLIGTALGLYYGRRLLEF
jgi:hypothetical protein